MNTNKQHSGFIPVFIHDCGMNSALGVEHSVIHERLKQGYSPDMQSTQHWLNNGGETVVGKVSDQLPALPEGFEIYDNATNRLVLSVLEQIADTVKKAIEKYGRDRVAVVVGTSVYGITDAEKALATQIETGEFPDGYHYRCQEVANVSDFVAEYFDIKGPVYTLSTACSSSGRVFLSAKRLLKAGIVDAVVVGGADSLCLLTLNGFKGLEALSDSLCNPFSENRKGINIGEAAAFMLLSLNVEDSEVAKEHPPVALLGAGDSSDAHHISAPHPEGNGAEEAMCKALSDAGLSVADIGYINAHGTATPLNDEMEAKAIYRVFGDEVPVSSTKPLTGHTLGAASAVEAAICWHILSYKLPLPVQVNDGEIDSSLAPVKLVDAETELSRPAILSNSFAFGGNNVSLIFGYAHD
ncbi:beta-ketoacyl-[acyl-carrier-protein] synthase family protein [Photobacterium sp. J15]|uniref:beta-ketoacyl-[acyl-carrier-protein] synthase family protein n=1 Tax=Photobacterium sp. J15 TaxID=265901 RepID=UPI0007E42B9F|nr:beta-ketoacyl-[acyl-carrier-protein] synthase family protein [Photobacterium sp. J15]